MCALRVTQCCCGCGLRDGTVYIGYYYTVIGFLMSIACFILLILVAKEDKTDGSNLVLAEHLKASFIGGGVSGLIQAVVSVLLAYGGHKEKTSYLIPWMVYALICFILGKIVIFILLISAINGYMYNFGFVLGISVYTFLLGYFLRVVNSYRKCLQEDIAHRHLSSAGATNTPASC